jgi:hypothetical protein
VSGIFQLFGKEVAGVDDARNVSNFHCAVLMVFTDTTFVKIDVFGAFEGDGGGPVDCGLVVVVYCDCFCGIGEAEVESPVFDTEEVIDAFVSCINFGNTRTVGCLILSDCFPSNGTTSAANQVA